MNKNKPTRPLALQSTWSFVPTVVSGNGLETSGRAFRRGRRPSPNPGPPSRPKVGRVSARVGESLSVSGAGLLTPPAPPSRAGKRERTHPSLAIFTCQTQIIATLEFVHVAGSFDRCDPEPFIIMTPECDACLCSLAKQPKGAC